MDIMDNYNNALQSLYNAVGFVEDWTVLPIDDRTDMFWHIDEIDNCVRFQQNIEKIDSDYYENKIYKQKFYDKWIYRGEKLTMIMVDTQVDGNQFFAFYDNNKEVK